MFKKEVYISRRNELKQKVGKGLLLFIGNNESPMNYADNTYTFRQDSSFLYYFGLNLPGLVALIDVEADRVILFGNDFTVDDIVWMGKKSKVSELAESVGILSSYPIKDLSGYISEAINKNREVHYLPPYRADAKIMLSELLGRPINDLDNQCSVDFIKAVVAQREIKSKEEIDEIEKAVNFSIDMHVEAMYYAQAGMTEAEVAAKVHQVALSSGGDISFPIIATINGQTLHNHYHGNVLHEGQMFLLDAGCQTELGYAGDLSSSFPISASFDQKQKDIYIIVQKAVKYAESCLLDGINFREVHKMACLELIRGLSTLGLMKGDTEEAYMSGAHALFFPCGVGHMMGMDVHDMENLGEKWVGYNGKDHATQFGLKSLRLSKPLKNGFVFTVEPGIYFIPELQELWRKDKTNEAFLNWGEIDKYKEFGGVRIEENYVIENGKGRKIGKHIPRSIEEIENIRSGIKQ